jgi:hypothetical protein
LLSLAERLVGEGDFVLGRELAARLWNRSPALAMAWAAAREEGGFGGMDWFWAGAVDATAGENPEAALPLTFRVSDGLRFDLVGDVFSEWAGEDPARARAAVLALTDASDREAAALAVLRKALASEVASALAWMETVPDPTVRDALRIEAMPEWGRHDPLAASAFTASLEPGDYRTAAAGYLAESWAQSNPAGAVEWAVTLGDAEVREEGLRKALETAAGFHAEEAADLALGISAEGERANALEIVLSAWAETDLPAARAWAARVADPRLRVHLEEMLAAER